MEIQQSLGGLEMILHNGRVYPQSSLGAADPVRQAGISVRPVPARWACPTVGSS